MQGKHPTETNLYKGQEPCPPWQSQYSSLPHSKASKPDQWEDENTPKFGKKGSFTNTQVCNFWHKIIEWWIVWWYHNGT